MSYNIDFGDLETLSDLVNSGSIERANLSVSDLNRELVSKKISLDAPYQRGAKWMESRQKHFLQSLFGSAKLNSISMNWRARKWWVIDGKQRLTSITRFYKNEIPIADHNNNVRWYDHVPVGKQGEVMSDDLRAIFDSITIPVQKIKDNMNEDQETSEFVMINFGVPLTNGEISKSYNIKLFKCFCKEFAQYEKLFQQSTILRTVTGKGDVFYSVFVGLLTWLSHEEIRVRNKTTDKAYLETFDVDRDRKIIDRLKKGLDLYCSILDELPEHRYGKYDFMFHVYILSLYHKNLFEIEPSALARFADLIYTELNISSCEGRLTKRVIQTMNEMINKFFKKKCSSIRTIISRLHRCDFSCERCEEPLTKFVHGSEVLCMNCL